MKNLKQAKNRIDETGNEHSMLVYKITNKTNNKIYIGKTTFTLMNRWESHLKVAKRKPHRYFYSAINHYGAENFLLEEIEKCQTLEQLNEREIYWIKYYDSTNHDKGYNLTHGVMEEDKRLKFARKLAKH